MHRQTLPPWALLPFAHLNNISLNGLQPVHIGGNPVDAGTVIKYIPPYDSQQPLLRIDRSLVLCASTVEEASKSDPRLREALAAAGQFALKPRGAIMVFLIVSMSGVGQRGAWSEYIKFLSGVSIPTTWTDAERRLLKGTSLDVAVTVKLTALESEFNSFRESTQSLEWAQTHWWNNSDDDYNGKGITLQDWIRVDSWFRSRVLQFPCIGIGMAPMLDFANHRKEPNAYYSVSETGDVVLLPRDREDDDDVNGGPRSQSCALKDGEEVTINYGTYKSAAEMVFSYGFVDEDNDSTLCMALDLECPNDDPLKRVKEAVFKSAPTLMLWELETRIDWIGDFVWLICVNEEDGLSFKVLQTVDGKRTLQVLWKNQPLEDIEKLAVYLENSELWPVYQLRTLILVVERVEMQLGELVAMEMELQNAGCDDEVGMQPKYVASRLREYEKKFMERAIRGFEEEKAKLLDTEVVQEYLRQMQAEGISGQEELGGDDSAQTDFS